MRRTALLAVACEQQTEGISMSIEPKYEKVIASMTGLGGLTIPEVLGHLAQVGIPTKGDRALMQDENVVIWDGISHEAIEAFKVLREDGRMRIMDPGPMTTMCYQMDGVILAYPLATESGIKKGSGHYQTMHWLPLQVIVERTPAR
jgi:hypothetical protein